MEWLSAVDALRPHIVRIYTPQGSGTGFLVARSRNKALCGIATAAHVVNHAYYWEQPLRIQVSGTAGTILFRQENRAILLDEARDTAAVVLSGSALTLPDEPAVLIERGYFLKVGNPVGWLGYPAIQGADLCFFNGTVSAWSEDQEAYFVDGVTINGVSGGPAFSLRENHPVIVGVVSAYAPNRVTGETLPGLSIVRAVAQFHDLVSRFESLDAAKEEEQPPTGPPPPSPAPSTEVQSQARKKA